MDYRDALRYIYSFTDLERIPGLVPPAGGLDLGKIHRFFDLLGRPEDRFAAVLVAGTKGKGSTASYLAGALRAAGYRTGLYTQPHLTSFRERMTINGTLLPEARLGDLVAAIQPVVDEMHRTAPEYGRLTTYEVVTGLALLYFAQAGVDFAVLEIGLGGRLDAVNAVRVPCVSVITALSLDHMRVLGDTIAQIAYEKAGIIKPGIPVVSAPQPPAGLAVIRETALARQAPLYLVGEDIHLDSTRDLAADCTPDQYGHPRRIHQPITLTIGARLQPPTRNPQPATLNLTLPLLGRHQAENAATAAAAALVLAQQGARLTDAVIADGFGRVEWPGRLEVAGTQPLLVLDGAHNGESAARLAAALGAEFCYRRLVLVLGMSRDKDLAAIVRPLLPLAAAVVVTQAQHPRAAPADEVAVLAAEVGGTLPATPPITVAPDTTAALAAARALAGPADAILVTGSLFVVGEARAALGHARAVDDIGGDFFYRFDKNNVR